LKCIFYTFIYRDRGKAQTTEDCVPNEITPNYKSIGKSISLLICFFPYWLISRSISNSLELPLWYSGQRSWLQILRSRV
jgi:hypothetical protein